MNPVKLSIVVPLYNEEESLKELHQKIRSAAARYAHEIIFVDDGSTDGSFRALLELKKADRRIRIIRFKKNFGKSYALDAGFKKSRGDLIVTMDADLQDDPAEIPRLIEAVSSTGLDLISGWKYKRQDPLSKTIPSKLYNLVIRIFTGVKLHDTNCGLKIYRKEALKNLNLYGSMYRFIPVLLKLQGFRSGEIQVRHHARKYGVSKFGASRLFIGMLDFLTILFLLKYVQKPLHFFGVIGMAFILAGGILVSYIVYLKITFGTILARFPLLNFGILSLVIGGQFFSIGLLGELIISTSLYKTSYIVEKEIN